MRGWIDLLIVMGGLLPLIGITWGGIVTVSGLHELDRQSARIAELEGTRDGPDTLRAEGIPFTTLGDLSNIEQDISRKVLRHALDDLRGPAVLTALGLASGVAGALLPLYVRHL